jgi:hypothetical protein
MRVFIQAVLMVYHRHFLKLVWEFMSVNFKPQTPNAFLELHMIIDAKIQDIFPNSGIFSAPLISDATSMQLFLSHGR